MPDFDPSPRSSKRRKLAKQTSRSTTKPISTDSNFSNTLGPVQDSRVAIAAYRKEQEDTGEKDNPVPNDDNTVACLTSSGAAKEGGASGAFDGEDPLVETGINTAPDGITQEETTAGKSTSRTSLRNAQSQGIKAGDANTSPMQEEIVKTPRRSISLRNAPKADNHNLEGHVKDLGSENTKVHDNEQSPGERADGFVGRELTTSSSGRSVPADGTDGTVPITENEDVSVSKTRSSGRKKRRLRRFTGDLTEATNSGHGGPVGMLSSPSQQVEKAATIAMVPEKETVAVENQAESIGKGHIVAPLRQSKRKTKLAKRVQASSSRDRDEGIDTVAAVEDMLEDVDEAMPGASNLLDAELGPRNSTPAFDDFAESPSLTRIKSLVLSRLTSKSLPVLDNLATEYKKVFALLLATTTVGEGNSMLVLGSRGSGKSTLIEAALKDLRREHGDDFHVVRLSGFAQTDDKLALREIWRQLGKEMQVHEDETKQISSYADTMASLLHLLSHPEELSVSPDQQGVSMTPKSVIFILDEFDLFATHPRQTLLYNLFDIAQAKKAPIAVLGCSTRVDVADTLEKRVKSRFSHRWVHLKQPKSLQEFEGVIGSALSVEVDHDQTHEKLDQRWTDRWNYYIKTTFLTTPAIQALIRQEYYTTKSIPSIFSSLYIPTASIESLDYPPNSSSSSSLSSLASNSLSSLRPPDSILHLINYLSHLQLSLLICAARLDAIHNAALVNFNLVYNHYVELASRSRMQSSASGALVQGSGTKIWAREIAKCAWEQLGEWDMIVRGSMGRTKVEDGWETRMWRIDVTLEEIGSCLLGLEKGLVPDTLGRWCREI